MIFITACHLRSWLSSANFVRLDPLGLFSSVVRIKISYLVLVVLWLSRIGAITSQRTFETWFLTMAIRYSNILDEELVRFWCWYLAFGWIQAARLIEDWHLRFPQHIVACWGLPVVLLYYDFFGKCLQLFYSGFDIGVDNYTRIIRSLLEILGRFERRILWCWRTMVKTLGGVYDCYCIEFWGNFVKGVLWKEFCFFR